MIYCLFGLLLAVGAATWAADRALIDDALAGRKKAMRTLVQRLLPVIRGRVTWRLRGYDKLPFTAEDLTQQVWITLLKDGGGQLRGYDPERGAALETYVGLIARREVGNALEKARAQKRGDGKVTSDDGTILDRVPTGGAEADRAVAARSELQALMDHLDSVLSERQRLVV
ncbi:MAG: sigma-70 family RNA polymerase sigma factor, partial [Myxococcales bacterium]|nr:sigma-70 family RNA polymerase sigma factor [Myxococcales bacterium]